MKYGTISVTCPLCGNDFSSEVFAGASQNGADLDGRPIGTIRKAMLDDYHECPHCGHIFAHFDDEMLLREAKYKEIQKHVESIEDSTARAWLYLWMETRGERLFAECISMEDYRVLCAKEIDRCSNFIWACEDAGIDVKEYRKEKIALLFAITELELVPEDIYEDLLIMLKEEYRRTGQFNKALAVEIDTANKNKQAIIKYEDYLSRKHDSKRHTIKDAHNFANKETSR